MKGKKHYLHENSTSLFDGSVFRAEPCTFGNKVLGERYWASDMVAEVFC